MGSLVQSAQEAYTNWKTANYPTSITGWDALSSEQVADLFRTEQKYKLAIEDAGIIESSFFEARADTFAAFEAQKQQEFVALQNLWQAKEDNGPYDVDYIPE